MPRESDLTVLTGALYPALITAVSQIAFPRQAEGSLVVRDGKLIGSALIGQSFGDVKYFWGRPSATTPQSYNGTASTGSNLGPLNPALTEAVKTRVAALRSADPGGPAAVPVDLVTTSASGLDPDISVAAARFQVARIARARRLQPESVQALVASHTRARLLGIVGEPRVNVLELNLALDALR
ncbi:MAG TPA: potassium-transporting ATPase subunit KdpC [Steroidobacteraceae bacterium]|nr:potassium-transporting ATPase subunit KdpC [Steroidobacteraceae bacterium]